MAACRLQQQHRTACALRFLMTPLARLRVGAGGSRGGALPVPQPTTAMSCDSVTACRDLANQAFCECNRGGTTQRPVAHEKAVPQHAEGLIDDEFDVCRLRHLTPRSRTVEHSPERSTAAVDEPPEHLGRSHINLSFGNTGAQRVAHRRVGCVLERCDEKSAQISPQSARVRCRLIFRGRVDEGVEDKRALRRPPSVDRLLADARMSSDSFDAETRARREELEGRGQDRPSSDLVPGAACVGAATAGLRSRFVPDLDRIHRPV
jgi:hypothetical protein